MRALLSEFWDFIDKRLIVRRGIVLFAVYLTWDSWQWGKAFAETHIDKGGGELAIIIGSVTAPVTLLLGWVVRIYSDARS